MMVVFFFEGENNSHANIYVLEKIIIYILLREGIIMGGSVDKALDKSRGNCRLIKQSCQETSARNACDGNRQWGNWGKMLVMLISYVENVMVLSVAYLYHRMASGDVDRCHRAWESKIHQTGGKSMSSRSVVAATRKTNLVQLRTYGNFFEFLQHQTSQPMALAAPEIGVSLLMFMICDNQSYQHIIYQVWCCRSCCNHNPSSQRKQCMNGRRNIIQRQLQWLVKLVLLDQFPSAWGV